MSSNTSNNKQLLYEVVVIRLFLIVMLVFYHAFAIFSGGWAPIEDYPEIPVYDLMDKLSYACLLETFVFISGYILGYQVRQRGAENVLKAKNIFVKKFKRLIIPSIIFSTIYLLMFRDYHQSILTSVYQILCGVGHMWFLPMLFWCFVIVYLIEKIGIKRQWAIVLQFFAMFMSFLPLPFGMGVALYYVIFFYVGYILQKEDIVGSCNIKRWLPILTISFVIAFLNKMWLGNIADFSLIGYPIADKILYVSLMTFVRFVCASVGIIMLYATFKSFVHRSLSGEYSRVLSECCFGVYLFQQFILKAIYESSVPQMINPYILPWTSFVITLILSSWLTIVIRKTKVGRNIL